MKPEEKERILDKIRKCMALATSAGEHEAAAALRQARALMAAHDISDLEMRAIDVDAKACRAGAVTNPPKWEAELASRLARIFGCRLIMIREDWYTASWSFVGISPANDVAAYAFDVLFRQCKRAREAHIRDALKRCKRSTKTRRADLFCEGWICTATSHILPLESGPSSREAIDAYMDLNHASAGTLKPADRNAGRQLSEREYRSFAAGKHAGQSAQLNQGVGMAPAPKRLEA
jgi:hypothetical protein